MLYLLLLHLLVLLQHDGHVPIPEHVAPGSQEKVSQSSHEGVKLLLKVDARAPSTTLLLLTSAQ